MKNSSTMYYSDGRVNPDERARTLRIGRLELCSCWFRGEMTGFIYIHWPGRSFPAASTFTLRVWRVMVGFRWYDKVK